MRSLIRFVMRGLFFFGKSEGHNHGRTDYFYDHATHDKNNWARFTK